MLFWMDGMEQYGAKARMLEGVGGGAAWSQLDSGWALSTANPATGTYHLRLTATASGGTNVARRVFGTASQVVGVGYRFSVSELPAVEDYDRLDSALVMAEFLDVSNNPQCRVCMGTDGSVYACVADTLRGRSDPCISPGGYHHIEIKVKIADSGGYIEVRVNEVTVLNLTGIDTQNTGTNTAGQFSIGEFGDVTDAGAQFGTLDVDDVYTWNDDASDLENTVTDFVGDKGVYTLFPNADTTDADFTKSTGVTGYTLIDEVPPANTDYLSDTTGAAKSIFGVQSLPGNVAEVIAMTPFIYCRKEEAGSVTIHGGLRVDTDETYGPDDSPSTAYAYLRQGPKTIDPSTGVAWANNAEPELIIERTA